MCMYFLMSSVIVNYKCSIGGFPVGVNWVLGRALVSIFVVWWDVGVFNLSKLLVRGRAW